MKQNTIQNFLKKETWDVVYTDGACKPNPGRGGWGFVVWPEGCNLEYTACGGELKTTNNRMEIMAILEFLKFATPGRNYKVHTDSEYCLKTIVTASGDVLDTPGVYGGYMKKWVSVDFEGKQNPDLWRKMHKKLFTLTKSGSKLQFIWVKGHANIPGNEKADWLANEGYKLAK